MKNVLQSGGGGRWEGRGNGIGGGWEGGMGKRKGRVGGREKGVYTQSREDGEVLSVCDGCVRSVRGECVGASSDSRAL